MGKGNEPAYPVSNARATDYKGMTLREHYAGLAMQGLLAHSSGHPDRIALYSCMAADALLKALERSHDGG